MVDYQCLKNHNIADPNGLLYGRVSYCLVISAIKRHWNKLLYIYHTHTSLLNNKLILYTFRMSPSIGHITSTSLMNNKLILYTFRMSPSIGQRRMLKSRWGLWLSNWRVWINKLTIWSCDSLPSSRRSVISKYISTWKSNSSQIRSTSSSQSYKSI